MAFDSLADFWAMGTHGVYVWTSYALTFSTIVLLLWHAKKARQRFFNEQIQQLKRQQKNHES